MCEPKSNGGMGFRQLKQFNLALLAKQGWRLQTKQDSLAYRVLKAKYFPKCEFVEASLGNNPSFSWRSIMAAQNLVREGIQWRVGNGTNIRIWSDKCLSSPSTYRVASPRQFLHQDTRVSELIDQATANWKTDVLHALFLPHEADVIKGIPLSSRLPADKLIWAEEPNGKFSVRSVYRVALRLSKSADQVTSSDRTQLRLFWKRIWDLPLPHKVRRFAWRACRDILPTKVNLMSRNVVKDQFCNECKMEFKTTGHLFWTFPRAQEVWSCSKIVMKPCYKGVLSF